ncbi:MAG: ATP-binding protein [Gammaproteobacteria bacterium]|nr:histidine kinase [Gammaproteobacteria bacterium]
MAVALLAAGTLVAVAKPALASALAPGLLIIAILGVLSLALLYHRIRHQLLEPLTHLRHWALRMQGGNLSARIPQPERGEFAELAQDINSLSTTLQSLSRHLDEQVQMQTRQLAHKARSLQVLYDMAACINGSRDLNDLLQRFLPVIMDLMEGHAALVRLLNDAGYMEIVSSIGVDPHVLRREHFMPVDCCLCGEVVQQGVAESRDSLSACATTIGMPLFPRDDIEMVAVPLIHRGRTLGLYNVFVPKRRDGFPPELMELLSSIGHHMGTAIEKTRLEQQTRELSIMQERNMIANELHDSLAQTLASLRFQVRVLDETLQQSGDFKTIQELEQVENSLDEAYSDLRDLIAHCRAPIAGESLVPSIEKLISRFRKESGISVFLQNEWRNAQLPTNLEIHVARIVQEALTNIRKHAKAHNVRILLRRDNSGNHHLLVEDDGAGFDAPASSQGKPGEHLGLIIMQERAAHVGGELRIESETGEGTRIELTFHFEPRADSSPAVSRAAP